MAAMNLYPRSFLRLILLAWAGMALPLLFAIAFASLSLTRITERSESAVQQAAMTARLGWEMEEGLFRMERLIRKYDVVHDNRLLDDYAAARTEWRQLCTQWRAIALVSPLATTIDHLLASEDAAQDQFAQQRDTRALLVSLNEIDAGITELLAAAGQHTEQERQAFRAEAEAVRMRLLVALIAAFLVAALMFWLGRRMIAKLLSRVERAVIVLGNQLFDRRIHFKGPEDLQWIGRRLDWLRRRLRALEGERTRILRHVSHELKTPLAALREGASLLSEGIAGPLSPQQAKIAGIMQGNALRLQELIDGLLKLQQAEHARERIQPSPLRLDKLIQDVLATQRLAARDKQLRISGTLPPLTIAGGQEEVTAILTNLISNAIKFSPDGAALRIVLGRDRARAVLDITDAGPGIPEAERERIFEPFYRTPGAKGIAGVGLGLAIARELALAQRGSLELMPSDAGAHFRVTLPLAEADA